jgi:hypothetical protein
MKYRKSQRQYCGFRLGRGICSLQIEWVTDSLFCLPKTGCTMGHGVRSEDIWHRRFPW